MWTREQSSIIGQYASKLAAARRRRDRKQPPYPHDNDILRWRGERENQIPQLLVEEEWVTLDQVKKAYGLKTRCAAASMVIHNLRARGFKFDKGGKGRWRLIEAPKFRVPGELVFIEEQVISEISGQPDVTGEELQAKLPDLTEKQIRSAVDSFRSRGADETIEGQYQPGLQVARRHPNR